MTAPLDLVKASLDGARAALEDFRKNDAALSAVVRAAEVFSGVMKSGGKVISCGNGGSMCDAMHFAEELSGRFRDDRPGLAAIAISDPSHLSCVGNDYGYEHVFSRYVEAVGRPGDALLAISTSGSSANVLRAAETARAKGMRVVALTGRPGSKIGAVADVDVCAPGGTKYADRVQELHIKIIHSLIELCETMVFGGGKGSK